jgi:hypothetical protein
MAGRETSATKAARAAGIAALTNADRAPLARS